MQLGVTLLIALLTLGGVGLFLAMPGGRADVRRAALVVLAGAAAALAGLVLPLFASRADQAAFGVVSLIGLIAAIRVITHTRPVYSALYFILVVIATAGLLLQMSAEFLAAALVIIYAGAILVTYIFVIMLAQQRAETPRWDRQARDPLLGVLSGFVLLGVISARLLAPAAAVTAAPPDVALAAGYSKPLGMTLFLNYVVGVQIAGVLLTAAMIGAIAVARRRPQELEAEGLE
ncbi:MAG: NADH-quinone oxidoreductase subunit J [Phycisphaerae bacterium]